MKDYSGIRSNNGFLKANKLLLDLFLDFQIDCRSLTPISI